MKTKLGRYLLTALLGGGVLPAVGCATTSSGERAVVACPGCKNVEEPLFSSKALDDGIEDYLVQHRCRACDGALQNFLENGEWKHTCSICMDNPYSCNL